MTYISRLLTLLVAAAVGLPVNAEELINSYRFAAGGTPTYIGSEFGSGGADATTTGSFDSTGGDFAVVYVTWYSGGTTPTVTDSKGNTYTRIGAQADYGLFYCPAATCGTGHTFTATGTGSYPAIGAIVFSGVGSGAMNAYSEFASTGETYVQAGSITPTGTSLVVAALGVNTGGDTYSIDSGYTGISNWTMGLGYKFSVTGATNPQWSWTDPRAPQAAIAAFTQ